MGRDKSDGSTMPAFVFPVVAWAPEPATGVPGDDGVRQFLTAVDIQTAYLPEDLRLGWTFVDVNGCCWEAVSSRVVGGAYPWWARLSRGWIWDRRYTLAVAFVERPPMSFDAVKSRLFAAVSANPEAYPDYYAADRRQELRQAASLRDLIKTEEQLAVERLQPVSLWWQWLFWEGRCSRRGFLAGFAGIAVGLWVGVALLRVQMPWFLVITAAAALLATSLVVRRLHDLGRTGWWITAWFLFNWLCAQAYELLTAASLKSLAAVGWQAVTLGLLGLLAVLPGTRGDNRYGFGRRGPQASHGYSARQVQGELAPGAAEGET